MYMCQCVGFKFRYIYITLIVCKSLGASWVIFVGAIAVLITTFCIDTVPVLTLLLYSLCRWVFAVSFFEVALGRFSILAVSLGDYDFRGGLFFTAPCDRGRPRVLVVQYCTIPFRLGC